jgi:16S rRNA (adenine1518-N6/adenine1519-N6)-dimethyltransferase
MIDKKILNKIVAAARLYKEDSVLEIGAGNGELTELLHKKSKVIAIEVDKELCKGLQKLAVKVICGNALDYLDKLKFNKIVANIPYSISEPLFTKLLLVDFEIGVFVIGSNFYELLKSNSKLGVLARAFFIIKLEAEVPRSCFDPEPRVDSVLIVVRPKKKLSEKDKILQSLVRQQDKKIKNALIKHYEGKKTKNEVREMLESIDQGILNKGILSLSNDEMSKFINFNFF